MHSHSRCTKTLFSLFCRTNDIDRINKCNSALEDDGQYYSLQFYYQALFSNRSDCFNVWKKIFQPCEVKRPVRLRVLSVTSFISEYDFSQNILCTTMQGVSITILTPKDNNNLFISYCIKSFHRLPPPPPSLWVVN